MSVALKPYSPKPFQIAVPDATLVDLRRRLQDVRWPDEVAPGWDYGVDLEYLRSLSSIGATSTTGVRTK
jgi:hypothetical protein